LREIHNLLYEEKYFGGIIMRLYTIREVTNLLGISRARVMWLIFTRKLRIAERRGFGRYIEGRNIAEYVYNHPEYDNVIRDRLGWDIADYRRMRRITDKLVASRSRG
jgi:hypothetical protein